MGSKVRDTQKTERKSEILKQALNLFLTKDYSTTTIADIAKACNMSTGLLFNYFDSKKSLYDELLEISFNECAGIEEYLVSDTSPENTLYNLCEFILNLIKEKPESAKMFMLVERSWRSKITASEKTGQKDSRINIIQKTITIVKSGQEAGIFREGNTKALVYAFWGAIIGLAEDIACSPIKHYADAGWFIKLLK